MKRFRRRVLNGLLLLSLLLGMWFASLWWRSYVAGSEIFWRQRPMQVLIRSRYGELWITCWKRIDAPEYWSSNILQVNFWPIHERSPVVAFNPDVRAQTIMGFKFQQWGWPRPPQWAWGYNLTVPYWFLVLCCLVPLIGATQYHWRSRRQRLRLATGLCPNCGYDLRSTPERCPECGKVIEKVI
jgi:hypothetical protein